MKFQRTTFNSMLGLLILVITMLANSSIAQAAEPTDALDNHRISWKRN